MRVLIVYYSFTQQTRLLLTRFAAGLEQRGVEVQWERLTPLDPYEFPFRSNTSLFVAMLRTFFRYRMRIEPPVVRDYRDYRLVVLAGPTWSYQPSGPILSFVDSYGDLLRQAREVQPLISCRSYWRLHSWELRWRLQRLGVKTLQTLVFAHPMREPFRFIGLVMQLRGKMVRKEKSWFRKHYPGYGHNKAQLSLAEEYGQKTAERLLRGETKA